MLGIVYKATNIENGKSYIGQTSRCLTVRKNEHINSGHKKNNYFHNALKKYGSICFNWNVLCECDSKNELDEMEFHYIKQYDTKSNGYNLTFGGEGIIGYKHTVKSRKKISKNHADTSGDKNGFFGRKHTKGTKRKMSVNTNVEGDNNPMYGKKHTKESINKNKWNNSTNLWFVETPEKQGIWLFNLSEFCRINKLNRGNITYSTTKGYEAIKLC